MCGEKKKKNVELQHTRACFNSSSANSTKFFLKKAILRSLKTVNSEGILMEWFHDCISWYVLAIPAILINS